MAGRYTSQKDLSELALYRQLAEINGRLDALKAMEAIENDLCKRYERNGTDKSAH
jgi:hypothetical protein